MENLDLLLVNAGGFRKKVYQELSRDYSAIEPPFWAALTAAFIRNKRFNVDILDANAENLDIEETAKKIEELNPKLVDIVVYGQHPSASTALMEVVGNLCREIKKLNQSRKIILTGLHPSALPEKTLKEEACDFVCEGEGFHTILDLLQNKNLPEILGLWYKKENEIKHNARAPLILDLDKELPDVAWDLLPMNKYKAHNWHCLHDLESRKSYASISTSLGCPFNCSFCCINAPFGKSFYRCWSSEWVLKQLDILVRNYNIKNIKFIDELFVFSPNHFTAIAKGIIERGYKLNIWAYARVDTTKEEHLKLLKQAGFNWFGLGIESGDEEVRQGVSKGRFEDENIRDVVKKIKDAGIYVAANYIFGLPEDTLESMQKTLNLALELNCEWANMYCTMAYPGSRLHKEAKEKGIILPEDIEEIGWIGYSQHSYETLPLPTKTLSPAQVLKFRDEAFIKYFTSKKYLDMIEEKFGKKAREHLENMTKTRLKRKLFENKNTNIDITEKVKNLVKPQYDSLQNWIHKWHHIKEAVINSEKLAKLEGVNPIPCIIAAYCHDLGRIEEEKRAENGESHVPHAILSIEPTIKLLKEVGITGKDFYEIIEAVAVHSYRVYNGKNKIAEILQDADKITGINAPIVLCVVKEFLEKDFVSPKEIIENWENKSKLREFNNYSLKCIENNEKLKEIIRIMTWVVEYKEMFHSKYAWELVDKDNYEYLKEARNYLISKFKI